MCYEGGCGCCVINAEVYDHVSLKPKNILINTCLYPLYSCDGIKFTTIEGIGSLGKGFSDIQKRIADYNGSQCGWCTPGQVMNMYSLLLKNPRPSKQEIENNFDGNICRCTGYRSILDAMKSFAVNEKPIDIEELFKLKCLNSKIKNNCNSNLIQSIQDENLNSKNIHIISDTTEWFSPNQMQDLYQLLTQYQSTKYRIVSGNTGTGVYKSDGPYNVYIDIKNIAELYEVIKNPNELVIGSELTLQTMIELFNDYSSTPGFEYLKIISQHISKIANVGVRNLGTWGGNLMMKYLHQDFPSDVFLLMETVDAVLTIVGPSQAEKTTVSPVQLLSTPMTGKIIYSASFQPFEKSTTFIKTYKIMPRSQNAHAYVNGGFRFNIDQNKYTVKSLPTIVFGGINKSFVHANKTERYLFGKAINDQNVLNNAFQILLNELVPDNDPVLASPEYRKSLAMSLFYKFILYVNSNNLDPKYLSGIESVIDTRDISSGSQSYSDNKDLYPVTQSMTKTNAYLQASGEAEYVYDIPPHENELFGAFIIATQGNCRLDKIDTSIAENMPGVVKILFAKDIPGKNTFIPSKFGEEEILFIDDFVEYAGQSVGLVVAKTFGQALGAARAVRISYKEIKTPILTIKDAIAAKSFFPKPSPDFVLGDPENAINNSKNVIEGECSVDTQFHFYMEGQVAICKPSEFGVEVYSSTQFVNLVQAGVANVLGLSNVSDVTVKVKQVGGGYGGKITRPNIPATAAAVACKALNKPVRVQMSLSTNMELVGKRTPWYIKYKIGFDDNGKLNAIIADVYCDDGSTQGVDIYAASGNLDNCYKCENWRISYNSVKTNLPANQPTRSPGTFSAIALSEFMIDHVAKHLNLDPFQVRQLNLYKEGDMTPDGNKLVNNNLDIIIENLKVSSDYDIRSIAIQNFNKNNRWKKKGLAVMPVKWDTVWNGYCFSVLVNIYDYDGSISVLHGGVEIGQGINTKIAQVIAYKLQVPINIISVKYSDSLSNVNCEATGSSVTSETNCFLAINCCDIINNNLKPIRDKMPSGYTWLDLINQAFRDGVDLSARSWKRWRDRTQPIQYTVFGAASSEVILDVLTGEYQILRTDIHYDCGQSINPEIDVGQAEGGFMMGLGNMTCEKVRYDPQTGQLLTNNTWEYKPPTTKDIPVDLRITFLKDKPNPNGVLGSKCVGEPPLCLSPVVALSIKKAIEAARNEISKNDFFAINAPLTVEDAQQYCLVDYSQFKLKD